MDLGPVEFGGPSLGEDPSYLRALLELTGALGIGTAWYWSNTDLNSLDWDYTWRWNSQRRRHTNLSGWRFDDNTMHLNTPGHPLAGGAYYALARANGLSIPGSFLAAMLTGLAWEAVVEYKEVVSLNDLILTGVAGVPLGEAFHQLGSFFRRSQPSVVNQGLAWIFGLPVQFHQWLDGTTQVRSPKIDRRGWPTDVWHRFDIGLGASLVPVGNSDHRHGFELQLMGELVDMEDYQREGKDVRWHQGALMTSMGLGATISPQGVDDFFFNGKLTFGGFHARRLSSNEHSRVLEGFNLFFGPSIAFEHNEYAFEEFRDRLGVVHLPGLTMHLRVIGEHVTFRYVLDLHPDFAALQSAALSAYSLEQGLEATKSVLENQGYYYAWGFSRKYRMELTYKALTLRSTLSRQNYRSIEGYDRMQYMITDDFSLGDRRTTRETSLEVKLPGHPISLGASTQYRLRRGTIKTLESAFDDRRLIARLRFGF